MKGYDALVFNTPRENLPDFGDLALSHGRTRRTATVQPLWQGLCLSPHLHLSALTAGTSCDYRRWVDYGHEFPPTLRGVHRERECPRPSRCPWCLETSKTTDELYMGLALPRTMTFLSLRRGRWHATPGGRNGGPCPCPAAPFPGWTRKYGDGKVFVLLPGHDGGSFQLPEFQQIVLHGVDWATAPTAR